jgi:hypothetical protein
MKRLRRVSIALAGCLITSLAGTTAIGQTEIRPSSPAVVAPPAWSRVTNMPDGRTFVTDGGLSVDVKFAKPAALPPVVIPPESAKILAGRLTAPYDHEITLGQLATGSFKNAFSTPDGISLNGNYVNFLRQVMPPSARLRTRGKTDPVVVAADGQPVAILMPLAAPTP